MSWDSIDPDSEEPAVTTHTVETDLEAVGGIQSFSREQQADSTLNQLFTQARDNSGNPYAIANGLLVRKEKDQLGVTQDLLLVPECHRRRVYEEAHGLITTCWTLWFQENEGQGQPTFLLAWDVPRSEAVDQELQYLSKREQD